MGHSKPSVTARWRERGYRVFVRLDRVRRALFGQAVHVACVIVIDLADRVALVRRAYVDDDRPAPPGGRRMFRDAPQRAAREAWEEIGIAIELALPLGTTFDWDGIARMSTQIDWYVAPHPGGEIRPRTGEIRRADWCRIDELPADIDLRTAQMIRNAVRVLRSWAQ